MGYDSLEVCQEAAEKEVRKKINIVLNDKCMNLFFYSSEIIIDNYVDKVDIKCSYNRSIDKWKYDLSGYMEINYRYKNKILDMPGCCETAMMIWTGKSYNKKILLMGESRNKKIPVNEQNK